MTVRVMALLFIGAYFAVLGTLALLGLYRLHLLFIRAHREAEAIAPAPPAAWPSITVQLPLYNEALVAERLIRAAARLRYPGPRKIQVLDDSTDETRAIVDRTARALELDGVKVEVLRRQDRAGFKAGALAFGLRSTDAELLALFDADFLPDPDFLERVVPTLLGDPHCSMVQARWGHLNRTASWLTRAQAIFLDGHFLIEHEARDRAGRFFNFNGTAGVWRRSAIEAAGGWSAETICEDLDLSYRAQLGGARFRFRGDVVARAELPERWAAFRSQQARWVRGSIETARRHLFPLLSKRSLSTAVRFDAAVHLINNFAYLMMAILALFLPAVVAVRSELGWRVPLGERLWSWLDLSMLTAGTLATLVFYAAAQLRRSARFHPLRVLEILVAMAIGAGMCISNAAEVVRGLFSEGSPFVRTPKRGDATPAAARARYGAQSPRVVVLAEIAFFFYFLLGTAYAFDRGLWGALPFLVLYLFGFGMVASGSIRYFSSS